MFDGLAEKSNLLFGLLPYRKKFLWEIYQDEGVSYGMDVGGSRLPFPSRNYR